MSNPVFNPKDPVGFKTLELFSKADNYNKWMFETLEPFCSNNILEIGSGTGNISKFFLSKFNNVTLSDLRQEYCELLNEKFSFYHNLKSVQKIDLTHQNFEDAYRPMLNSFDTIVALNVIEHIKTDLLAIENCNKLLRQNGRLVILVPAYQSLHNLLDKMLDHYRRYTVGGMMSLTKKAGFKIIHYQYFNLAGILGWWLCGSVLKKKVIPGSQLKLFNYLTGLIKWIDKITFSKIGLSVIVISEK